MPQQQSVAPATLELIRSLQSKSYLEGFYLVGGTALAMYFSHRRSIDIDLFTNTGFDSGRLLEQIQQGYPYRLFSTSKNTLKGYIDEVNVDLIAHRYSYLQNPKEIDGVELLSLQDILAMKLNAISVSGQRSKDFIDIYYGLMEFDISEMIKFYKRKYQQKSAGHVLKSLVYFDDVDLAGWPVLLQNPDLKWETVKKELITNVKDFTLNG